jgi:hypothetical protein
MKLSRILEIVLGMFQKSLLGIPPNNSEKLQEIYPIREKCSCSTVNMKNAKVFEKLDLF